jgi:hypothetical protein
MTTAAAANPPAEPTAKVGRPAADPLLVPRWGIGALGVFLLACGAVNVYALVVLWPAVTAATGAGDARIAPFGHAMSPSPDTALLLLVVVSSTLGSFIHAATSFTDYVGNRKLAASWAWWYVLRSFIGCSLALLFYFSIRGGFLGANTPAKGINPYGIAAVSGLVGLFSKQATDKLHEVFDTVFRTAPGRGDDARTDSITNPIPVIAGLEPPRTEAGSDLVEAVLRGAGFVPESVVRLERGGEVLERKVVFVGPTELRVQIHRTDVAEAGTVKVHVFNPPPGGGISAPAVLEVVTPAPAPA